jgi:uncharacterized integral membrane protein
MFVILIFALVLCLVALIFAIQNPQTVSLSFLLWNAHSSLALIIILVFLVGLLAGVIIGIPARIRNSIALSRKKKEAADLESQLSAGADQSEKNRSSDQR